MDKRKIYGSILGIIFFIGIIVSLTYARYVWKSEDTMLTFNISDSYFYCESGISSEISELAPVLDYRAGSYQTFKVNNIGRQDTTFSVSLNITAIDESLISGALKYKLMVDKTGGSNNCADTTNSNCVEVEGGSGDFASAKVGMNTLAKVVTIPNNAKYQYYLFIYIDGNMENDLSMQNSSMTAILDVCEIVVFLDYNGGTGEKEFLKVTSNYTGLPTTAEREDTTVIYNTNGGSTVSSDSISYEFGGWYFDTAFANKVTASTTVTSTINHTLYAKWIANKSLTLPTPTKTGYTFAGWYSNAGLTNKVGDAGASYNPNTDKSSITLYAKWVANSYNIAYTLNNGTAGSNHPATATYDKVITIDNPTRTDYTFQGWTSSTINTSTAKYGLSSSAVSTSWSNGSTKVTSGYFKNLTATKGATVTLIANWKDAKAPVCTISTPATVVYGNTTTATVQCTDNDSISSQTLSTSNFTSSDTTVATIKSVSSPTAITGGYKYTVTITGVKAGTYTISLNAGTIKDNAGNKNVKVTSGTGTINSETKTGTFYYYNGSKIAVATATCSKSSSSSECTYTVPNEVSSSTGRYGTTYRGVASNLSTTTTTTPTSAKQVYYAVYSKAVSIHYPTSTSACSTTAYTGYRNEWFTSTSAMTQVIGSSNTATTNITTISGILGTLKGLANTVNTASYQTVEASAATTTTTFYAVSTSSVTATFYYSTLSTSDYTYTNGAQTSTTGSGTRTNYCTNTSTATVSHGNITVPSAVSGSNGGQAASNYAGVSKSKSSATLITPTTANTTYYAVYKEDLTFYYYNGSSNTTTKLTRYMLSNGTSYSVSLSANEPIPSSYDGASYYAWSYQSGASSSDYIREPLSTGTNTLYAIYKKTITISYNANGGSGAPSSQTGTKYYTNNSSNGITVTNPSITLSSTKPTKTGYTFSVWKDGGGTSYNANTAYTFSVDTTLTANWSPISYNIAYTLNNGSSGSSAPTSATYNTIVNISNPTKTVTVTGNANSTGATVGPATSNTFDFAGWTASNLNTSTAKFGTNSSNVTSSWSSGSTKVTNEYFKNLTATSGATVTLTANWTAKAITTPTLSKTGYTCKWNTKADGSGTSYNAGASFTPTANTTNITLYARCTANSYKIAYKLNNGNSGSSAPTSATYDTVVNISNPTKTATITLNANSTGATISSTTVKPTYTFSGWTATNLATSTAKYGTSSSAVSTSWSNASTKVVATYFKNLNPTSGATVTLTANWTVAAVTLPTVTKTGYTCSWNTKADGSGTSYVSGASYTSDVNGGNITLYARCTANQYTLTVNPNGGSYNGTTSNSTFKQGYDTSKNVGAPTVPTGYKVTMNPNGGTISTAVETSTYTFNGWTLSGSGQYVAASKASTGSMTRTAKNNSSIGDYENFTYSASAPTSNTWYYLRYPAYTYTPGDTYEIRWKLRVNTLSGSNFSFRHSALSNDYGTSGLVTKNISSANTNWTSYSMTRTFTGTTTTLNSNTVTIAPVFEAYTANLSGVTTSANFDVLDMLVINKSKDKLLQSNANSYLYRVGDGTLTAKYTHNAVTLGTPDRTYTVTYNSNSTGATIGTASTNVVYTFNGWYTAASGGTKVGDGGASYTPTAATTLYAQWTSKSTTLTTLSKTGHTCNWNTASDGSGTSYSAGATYTPTANVTLYAVCTANQYTVSYESNLFSMPTASTTSDGVTVEYDAANSYLTLNGTMTSTTVNLMSLGNQTFTEGEQYKITLTYVSGSYTSTEYSAFVTDVRKDASNTALSVRNSLDLTFPTSGTKTGTLTVSSTGASEGKALNNWIWCNAANGITFSNYKIKVNVTKVQSSTVTYGQAYGTLPPISREGYTFNGWYTAASGGTEVTSSTTVSTASDHTLYAQWLVANYVVDSRSYVDTLKNALTIAENGSTIELLRNYKDTSVVDISKSIIFNLKSYTWTRKLPVNITNDGSLTLEGNGEIVKNTNSNLSSGNDVLFFNQGTLNINYSGTFNYSVSTAINDISYVLIINDGTATITNGEYNCIKARIINNNLGKNLTITGGSYTSNNSRFLYNEGTAILSNISVTSTSARAIENTYLGTLTLSSGTISITDGARAIQNAGIATITGGTITAPSASGIYTSDSGSTTFSGGTVTSISAIAIYHNSTGTTTISGGTAKSSGDAIVYNASESGIVKMTSGTLAQATEETAIGIYNKTTGSIIVSGGAITTSGARAIQNEGGGTVTVSGTAVLTTTNARGIQNETTGKIEFKGGTLTTNSATGIYNNGSGTLNISGGTISSSSAQAVYHNSTGITTISGGTLKASGTYITYNESTSGTLKMTGGKIEQLVSGQSGGIYNKSTGIILVSGGTITTSGARAIQNAGGGTVTVSGTATLTTTSARGISNVSTGTINFQGGTLTSNAARAISNDSTGKVNISGGSVTSTSSDGFANAGGGTGNITGGTITSNSGNAIYNGGTGTITIMNTTIKNNASTGTGIKNASTGIIRVYDSTISAGSTVLYNSSSDTSTTPSFVLFDSTITGTVTGRVITFLHIYDWYGEDIVQIGIFNTTVTKCPTWTNENAQDDIQWYTTSSATTSSGQSYLYANVAYSNHNSTSSLYYTDLYNGDTYLARMTWYWNY